MLRMLASHSWKNPINKLTYKCFCSIESNIYLGFLFSMTMILELIHDIKRKNNQVVFLSRPRPTQTSLVVPTFYESATARRKFEPNLLQKPLYHSWPPGGVSVMGGSSCVFACFKPAASEDSGMMLCKQFVFF